MCIRESSGAANISDDVIESIADRTDGVSGVFIKELIRRSLQFHLARSSDHCIELGDVESALNEMMCSKNGIQKSALGFGRLGARAADGKGRQQSAHPRT